MALVPQRRWAPLPMEINLGTYNIWDGQAFGLPKVVWVVQKGNYNIMLLMDKKIHDGVYCCNRLGYDVSCSMSKETDGDRENFRVGIVSRESP